MTWLDAFLAQAFDTSEARTSGKIEEIIHSFTCSYLPCIMDLPRVASSHRGVDSGHAASSQSSHDHVQMPPDRQTEIVHEELMSKRCRLASPERGRGKQKSQSCPKLPAPSTPTAHPPGIMDTMAKEFIHKTPGPSAPSSPAKQVTVQEEVEIAPETQSTAGFDDTEHADASAATTVEPAASAVEPPAPMATPAAPPARKHGRRHRRAQGHGSSDAVSCGWQRSPSSTSPGCTL